MTRRNRGLAALYKALEKPAGPHLDDETLAAIVDAELAGEKVGQLYPGEIGHIESCEHCASTYSDLLLMMQEVVGDMALAAEAISPIEAYTAFLQREIQKKTGELALLPELVAYLAAALARKLKRKPDKKLPPVLLINLIQEWPASVKLTADMVKTIAAVISQNTAALSIFLTGQAAVIWRTAFSAAAELIENKYCLKFDPLPTQLGEPKATYEAGTDRLLARLAWPEPPLQVEARLSRQTALTCRLTIQLQGAKGTALGGHRIYILYYQVEESAETDADGAAYFNDIPIAALPELKITVEH